MAALSGIFAACWTRRSCSTCPYWRRSNIRKDWAQRRPSWPTRLGSIAAKTAFSCAACDSIAAEIERLPVRNWLVVGIEAHVCVLQTVMDLLSAGFRVFVAVDAVGSRNEIDCRVALDRMNSAGATLTTCESAMFEWCVDSSASQFKQLSQLIKETQPDG